MGPHPGRPSGQQHGWATRRAGDAAREPEALGAWDVGQPADARGLRVATVQLCVAVDHHDSYRRVAPTIQPDVEPVVALQVRVEVGTERLAELVVHLAHSTSPLARIASGAGHRCGTVTPMRSYWYRLPALNGVAGGVVR